MDRLERDTHGCWYLFLCKHDNTNDQTNKMAFGNLLKRINPFLLLLCFNKVFSTLWKYPHPEHMHVYIDTITFILKRIKPFYLAWCKPVIKCS